ncbi:monooxygenase [Salmonella enterica subsp. arizonae]|uniref:Monooxygenase n=1 Tax=Salmonella enterica subsp. arizonae TaxID=59203 RepID=A0A2X4T162_SALER|nr:monooxygenase [Salmonella enterica subsp. arizonae]
MTTNSVPFSVLDLAPIPEGACAKEAFSHSLDLARLAEKRGYHRYWLAEHHNMTGIASAATSVLIGYLAANTTTLHLGSGGVNATEPFTAGDCRAVRYAEYTLPRTN